MKRSEGTFRKLGEVAFWTAPTEFSKTTLRACGVVGGAVLPRVAKRFKGVTPVIRNLDFDLTIQHLDPMISGIVCNNFVHGPDRPAHANVASTCTTSNQCFLEKTCASGCYRSGRYLKGPRAADGVPRLSRRGWHLLSFREPAAPTHPQAYIRKGSKLWGPLDGGHITHCSPMPEVTSVWT